MSSTAYIDQKMIRQWMMDKLSPDAAEEQLRAKGLEPLMAAAYIREFKRQRNVRRQRKGVMYTGIGAFLGFVSCLLAIFNPIPELYDFFLYGLIILSTAFICYGLYCIFE